MRNYHFSFLILYKYYFMRTLIIKSEKNSNADILMQVAKKMGMKARYVKDEEMEDFIFGKLIAKSANESEEVGEEEGLKILRSYGFKV